MTREEAIKVLSSYDVNGVWADVDGKPYNAEEQAEAFDMAIEALQAPPISQRSMYQAGYRQGREEALERERTDEWCTDCKEYDTEKKCCPRFNKVIRGAVVDRPKGEWINTALSDRSDNIICDQCGYDSIARYNFCPNCGADMRGDQNE